MKQQVGREKEGWAAILGKAKIKPELKKAEQETGQAK